MSINNKKFLIITLAIQIAFCLVLFLDSRMNLLIPRFIIGFIYLTFIPGILILRVLKLNDLNLENLLYSIGLSLSFLMFVGFMLNIGLPYVGIDKPLTLTPLVSAIGIFVFVLMVYLYGYDSVFNVDLKPIIRRHIFLLIGLPLIVCIGSYNFLYYNNNLLLIIALFLIAILVIYATRVTTEIYPIIILTISVALLLYGSLGSKYVIVYGDPHVEYYFANIVRTLGSWNMTIRETHNAMLEVVILQPIYSILLGLNLTWTFKIIYPLLFSFCSLVIYLVVRYQFDKKFAFLSTIIFMFNFPFYNSYANGTRWGISLFFMSLIILTIVSNNLTSPMKELLTVIFSLSLVVSHYTTSYIFMFSLVFISMFYIIRGINSKPSHNFTLFYLISTFGYYIYVSSSISFELMFSYFRMVLRAVRKDILSPNITYFGFAIDKTWPISVKIALYFYFIFIFLALLGQIITLYELKFIRENSKLNHFYFIESIIFNAYIVISILGMLGGIRAFFMSLLFISPFIVKSYLAIFDYVSEKVHIFFPLIDVNGKIGYTTLSIILATYFLFSSGFVSETITRDGDYSPTVFINKNRSDQIKDPYFTIALARGYISDIDVYSSYWLSKYRDPNKLIYVDAGTGKGHAGWVTLESYGMIKLKGSFHLLSPHDKIDIDSYVYLREYNVKKGVLFRGIPLENYSLDSIGIQKLNKIYTNSGSEIYYCED